MMTTKKWLSKNAKTLVGKTVAISGSTGGIGKELCRIFASVGASLLMMDRNEAKAKGLSQEIRQDYPHCKIDYISLDLEDIESVHSCCEYLLSNTPDYIILNAGAYHIPRKLCALGYNNILQINYISPYYIARTLLSKIQERGGKIVAVGSIANGYSEIDINDPDFSTRKSSALAYGNAKRRLMYSLCALNSHSIAIAHPGITLTNITAHYPKLIFAIIKHPMKVIFMKPKRACLGIVKAVFSDTNSQCWTGPRYFDVWGLPTEKKLKSISEKEKMQIAAFAEKCYGAVSLRIQANEGKGDKTQPKL